MDYNSIRISPEKLTRAHGLTAGSKLQRLMFALSLYPDWKLAETFAGIALDNHHVFLRYWLDDDIVDAILTDVRERRRSFSESEDICVMLENAYRKLLNGQDHLNPFLSDDEFIAQELKPTKSIWTQEEMLGMIGMSEFLTYESVLENVDRLVEMERIRKGGVIVDSGRYWIVTYRQVAIKGTLRPFVLLARVSEDNKILTVQGIWPLAAMKRVIERMVPLPYISTLTNLKYIAIETEMSEAGPFKFRYSSIKKSE